MDTLVFVKTRTGRCRAVARPGHETHMYSLCTQMYVLTSRRRSALVTSPAGDASESFDVMRCSTKCCMQKNWGNIMMQTVLYYATSSSYARTSHCSSKARRSGGAANEGTKKGALPMLHSLPGEPNCKDIVSWPALLRTEFSIHSIESNSFARCSVEPRSTVSEMTA